MMIMTNLSMRPQLFLYPLHDLHLVIVQYDIARKHDFVRPNVHTRHTLHTVDKFKLVAKLSMKSSIT